MIACVKSLSGTAIEKPVALPNHGSESIKYSPRIRFCENALIAIATNAMSMICFFIINYFIVLALIVTGKPVSAETEPAETAS